MTFRFDRATIALTDPDGTTEQGSWTVRSEQGAQLVIETTEARGRRSTVTKILSFTGDDRIEISRPGKPDRIYLRRIKNTSPP
jgi:hypothetical protein